MGVRSFEAAHRLPYDLLQEDCYTVQPPPWKAPWKLPRCAQKTHEAVFMRGGVIRLVFWNDQRIRLRALSMVKGRSAVLHYLEDERTRLF